MPLTAAEKAARELGPKTLGLFVLNVGDGDAIILRFPPEYSEPSEDGTPRNVCAVIDCYDSKKTIDALQKIEAHELAFVCATHPHSDHIAGLEALLRWCDEQEIPVREFWDSGFRHVSSTHYKLVSWLVNHPEIQFLRPTSGFETIQSRVMIKVLSPSILLKNRYDTYGTNINNASIVLKLEYPPADIAEPFADLDEEEILAEDLSTEEQLEQNTVILGGDAQFTAWGRITEEYPELVSTKNRGQLIDATRIEHRPLRCQVLKVPHHMSKHGIGLEVLETLRPTFTLASCSDRSKHGFPHELTVMAIEDLRRNVKDKGIRFTGHPKKELRAGSLVVLMNGDGKRPKVYGLGDTRTKKMPFG